MTEIFPTLSVGATLVLRPADLLGPDEHFIGFLNRHAITVTDLPTAFWHLWAQEVRSGHSLPGAALRLVIVGGEKAEQRHLASWMAATGTSQWFNTYGPTEATIYATALMFGRASALPSAEVAIGRPVANTQIHVLDQRLQAVPLGVAGEIHIGGAGVARGYLNRDALTAERFIADPFSSTPGARLYKSGDLARWLPDGTLEYLGRNDDQVKLRGFRIELGEIASALTACEGVRDAVVVAREDTPGDKRLVAYVIAAKGQTPVAAHMRTQLARTLAEYMLPSAFVSVDRFPLTTNGKLDREALPPPDLAALITRQWEAPQGEVESAIAAIWQELLQVERVGRHDQFFELGGHSLLAVQLMARIQQTLAIEVPIRALFAEPSLEGFAAAVLAQRHCARHASLVPIRPAGTRTPLFLVHPGEGEIGYARALAPSLDPDMPVYGLAASGFLRDEPVSDCVEEMAANYLAAIRQVQPHGPYRLAGWSAGGTIAYEIANQLAGADEVVEFLGLIDTRHDYHMENAEHPDLPSFMLDALPPQLPSAVRLQIQAHQQKGDIDAMIGCAQQAGALPSDLDGALLRRLLEVRHGISKATYDYAPPTIPAPLTLFAALDVGRVDRSLGWDAFAGPRLQLVPVRGDHYSIMERANIGALGAAITKAIDEAGERQQWHGEADYTPRISIQRGSPGVAPLFCVPGAGASVAAFNHLAQALGADLPLHGLQPRGLCGVMAPHSDVESAARAYIRAIRQVSARGPYRLLGHSYGGAVVTEMARQLHLQGDRIGALIVLDADAPAPVGTAPKYYSRTAMLERLVQLFDMNLETPMGLKATDFAPLAPEQQLKLLLTRLIEVKLVPARTSLQAIRGIVRVFGTNLNANYRVDAPYPDPVHVAGAPDPVGATPERPFDPDLMLADWRRHAPKASLWVGTGNHLTLLAPPHVDALAAWIRSILDGSASY